MEKYDQMRPRVRLFKSERLEKLTLIDPVAFALVWGTVLPLIAWSGWGQGVGFFRGLSLFLIGLAVWSVFEYALHRYLFHWSTEWAPVRWLVFLIHGNHHAYPNDRMRNLMPLVVSLPIAFGVWSGSRAAIGPAGAWVALGFLCGYVIYDVIHFACHQKSKGGRLFKLLKQHHMRHHYIDQQRNFAISAIFWDRVFGTRVP